MSCSTVGCIVTLTLSLLAMALAATAQPAGKVPRISWLTTGVRPAGPHPLLEAFRQGLRDLGYVEGQEDRCPALAAELVRLPVDVLVAAGTVPIQAAQHATRTIPIGMAWGTDPVAQGFVASLARSEGNITGVSAMRHDLLGKQQEWLTQMVPTASRNPDDLQRVLAALPREGVHTLLLNRSRPEMTALALQRRLPTMYHGRRDVEAGGLMAYGPSQPAMHSRAASYVDRLLKRTPPAELPVEQPRKVELVLNRKTAPALGLSIPPNLLILTEEVIK
jgi:putative ABC transport system substrate-binding protein